MRTRYRRKRCGQKTTRRIRHRLQYGHKHSDKKQRGKQNDKKQRGG